MHALLIAQQKQTHKRKQTTKPNTQPAVHLGVSTNFSISIASSFQTPPALAIKRRISCLTLLTIPHFVGIRKETNRDSLHSGCLDPGGKERVERATYLLGREDKENW